MELFTAASKQVVRLSPLSGWRALLKAAFDVTAAGLAILLLLPVLVGVSLAIWMTMGRPILFRQTRVGKNGRRFQILKFRTLPARSDDVAQDVTWAEIVKTDGDVVPDTRLARLLRASSLDELPQLLNVVCGHMSLVGPRPERPELVELFVQEIPGYEARHRVKVGITGLAQVHGVGRGWERFSKRVLEERVRLDNDYIDNWSFGLDLRILAMTWRAVFRFRQSGPTAGDASDPLSADVDVGSEVATLLSRH
ncbi:MAG TPA: sugar transferase [Gaiellaceae bacterium]|nr:sugar transferase [Gaiellaceae bacterium]